MNKRRFLALIQRGLLAFSFALLFFGYGLATMKYRVFPYQTLRDAKQAFGALVEVVAEWKREKERSQVEEFTVPTVRNHEGGSGRELILVSGGKGYLKSHSPEHGALAWLMDRQGNIKHVWDYDPRTWDDLQNVRMLPGISNAFPMGLHLYDDGSLLASFQGRDSFPYAVGIAKFDRESRLIWKKELSHHWFSVAEDGRIFAPSLHVVDSPIPIGETRAKILGDGGKILADSVMILDPNGNVLEEISMIDALADSGWTGLFQGASGAKSSGAKLPFIDVMTDDPTHLNDVRLVDEDLAARHAWLSAGDLLLSFRSLNAVGILDAKTKRFKWMSAGRTLRQHSPRLFDDGILIFDNLGGPEETGGTRLVRVDLDTDTQVTVFPRPSQALPDRFHVVTGGHLDLHPDGGRVLMAMSDKGSVWEIDVRTGKVLWEYIYVHPGEDGARQRILTAKYVRQATFPLNQEGENR